MTQSDVTLLFAACALDELYLNEGLPLAGSSPETTAEANRRELSTTPPLLKATISKSRQVPSL
jgi:hypothetical protein